MGKTDTTISIGERELTDSEAISKKWIINFVKARDWIGRDGDSVLNGVIKVIDTSGRIIMIYSLMSEGRQGNYYEYYPNGQLKVKGQYCDLCPGIAYGTWCYYDEKGVLLKQKKIKRIKCNHGEICE
jgi:antitoxin component YwqK of YwqJK toxin-antitoxin module